MRWFLLCGLLWAGVLLQTPVSASSETRYYSKILPIRIVQKVIDNGYTAIDENYSPCPGGVCPMPSTPSVTQDQSSSCVSCTATNNNAWGEARPIRSRVWFPRLRGLFGRFRR